MSAVTLPGYPRGAPVIVLDTSEEATGCAGERLAVGETATVTSGSSGSGKRWCVVAGETSDGMGPAWSELPAAALALDLTDPTGMDLAARWLAERHGFALTTAPWWTYEHPSPTPRDSDGAPYREDWPARWVLISSTGDSLTFCDVAPEAEEGEEGWYPESWIVVRGIGTTNPAEALALACLAVSR